MKTAGSFWHLLLMALPAPCLQQEGRACRPCEQATVPRVTEPVSSESPATLLVSDPLRDVVMSLTRETYTGPLLTGQGSTRDVRNVETESGGAGPTSRLVSRG